MPEETFKTPQIVESKRTTTGLSSFGRNWPKMILATVLGLTLLATSAYAGYWYGIQQAQEKPSSISEEPKELQTYDFEGELAFVRKGDIWLINADGTEERKLTSIGTAARPLWSPGGKYIAFKTSDKIGVLEVSSGDITYIANGDFPWPYRWAQEAPFYQWSSDSSGIYYIDEDKGLMLADVGTQSSRLVAAGAIGPIKVVAGRVYFYVWNCPGAEDWACEKGGSVYSVDANGHNKTLALDLSDPYESWLDDATRFVFDVSPDGTRLAYKNTSKSVGISNIDGSDRKVFSFDTGEWLWVDYLKWAAEGKELYVHINKPESSKWLSIGELWSLSLDGSRVLVCEGCGRMSFSPNGANFVSTSSFLTEIGGDSSIAIYRMLDGERFQLTQGLKFGGARDFSPAWRPM